jgi:hypothetical protein
MAISYSVPENQISQITLLRVVPLSYLGPEIVRALLARRQSRALTPSRLRG